MLPHGSTDRQWCVCPLNLLEGCPRVPRTTTINGQEALLKCWGPTVGSGRLILLKSTILAKYVTLRVKGPPAVRVPVESPRRMPYGTPYNYHQRAGSTTEVLRPHGWIVTAHIAQIDHSDQICYPTGQQTAMQRCACPLNLLKECLRVPHTTIINGQGALLKCWGLTAGS